MAYASGKKRYLGFCVQFGVPPLPLSEIVLCRFVAFLFASSLSYQSIRCYLSAARHLQIMMGLPDPSLASFPCLDYALRGMRRGNLARARPKRLPITQDRGINELWSKSPPSYDRKMLWAAFCVGFFGFVRAGEFTCPSRDAFTTDMLSVGDVAVDSRTAPSHLTVLLKRSKADPFGAGSPLYIWELRGTAFAPLQHC